jgi:hypothetical protein
MGWGVGLLLLGALGAGAQAQDGPPPQAQAAQPMGTVTGRVVAQDTQQPARFAMVMLQNVATAANEGDGQERRLGGGSMNTRTDAEGNFTLEGVAPGDYYATASAPGYIPLRMLLQAAVSAGADPASLLKTIPQVHVDVQGTSSVTVMLERGGTISGRVAWEDGSPAAGISVNAVAAAATGASASLTGAAQLPPVLQGIQSPGGGQTFAMTDDRGAFRIAGLPAGDYLLRSVIQQPTQQGGGRGFNYTSPIRVYSPGVFRKADAKAITVKAGEERTDVRMVIDLRSLRTVSGHAGSTSAGQSVASGRVALADPNDSDLQLVGSIGPNGDFSVRYVPAGNYTLRVSGASSQAATGRGRGSSEGAVFFQQFTQPVVVSDTDVTGVGVTLTPVASQP